MKVKEKVCEEHFKNKRYDTALFATFDQLKKAIFLAGYDAAVEQMKSDAANRKFCDSDYNIHNEEWADWLDREVE